MEGEICNRHRTCYSLLRDSSFSCGASTDEGEGVRESEERRVRGENEGEGEGRKGDGGRRAKERRSTAAT